jgi:hypothetical protein
MGRLPAIDLSHGTIDLSRNSGLAPGECGRLSCAAGSNAYVRTPLPHPLRRLALLVPPLPGPQVRRARCRDRGPLAALNAAGARRCGIRIDKVFVVAEVGSVWTPRTSTIRFKAALSGGRPRDECRADVCGRDRPADLRGHATSPLTEVRALASTAVVARMREAGAPRLPTWKWAKRFQELSPAKSASIRRSRTASSAAR